MVKVIVIENFTLARFDELKNLERADGNKNLDKYLYKGDKFECTDEMAEYLTKTNKETIEKNKVFVEIMEIIPDKAEETIDEKPKRIRRKRTTSID